MRRKGLTEFSLSYQPSFNWRGYRNDHAYTDLKLEPGTAGSRHMEAWKDEESGRTVFYLFDFYPYKIKHTYMLFFIYLHGGINELYTGIHSNITTFSYSLLKNIGYICPNFGYKCQNACFKKVMLYRPKNLSF